MQRTYEAAGAGDSAVADALVDEAVAAFRAAVTLRQQLLHPFHLDLASSVNALGMLLVAAGRFRLAAKWVLRALHWYSWAYPASSPILGLQHLVYARLLWRDERLTSDSAPTAAAADPAVVGPLLERVGRHLTLGLRTVRAAHGAAHPLVVEAEQTLRDAGMQLAFVRRGAP